MRSRRHLVILCAILSLKVICLLPVAGQVQEKQEPYYLNVNRANSNSVHEINNKQFSLQYDDRYGEAKTVTYTLYNWKREVVKRYTLNKDFGLNNFNISTHSLQKNYLDQILIGELKDENDNTYTHKIKFISPKETPVPKIDLVANPVELDCDAEFGNLVEFYGQVSGGKAPYKTSWVIMNGEKTDFLYQPRSEVLPKPGKSMVIQIDQNPAYYVLFQVEDACGNQVEKMIYLSCNPSDKQINTLFIETIPKRGTGEQ